MDLGDDQGEGGSSAHDGGEFDLGAEHGGEFP